MLKQSPVWSTPGCFICGGYSGYYPHTSKYLVSNKQSGQNICEMFKNIGVRLDCWDAEEKLVVVVIGSCSKHKAYLDILNSFISKENIIAQEIINKTKNYSIEKFEITDNTGIEICTFEIRNIKDIPHAQNYLFTSSCCLICNEPPSYGLKVRTKEPIFNLFSKDCILIVSDTYILSCEKHKKDLEHLIHVIEYNGGVINKQVVEKVNHDSKFNNFERQINCSDCSLSII